MPTILPLLCFFSILGVLGKFRGLCWRSSFLLAALLWGFLLTVITEFLSLARWLDFWPVLGTWGIVFLLLLVILIFGKHNYGSLKIDLQSIRFSGFELFLLVYVFLVVVAIGVIAWVAPPNTWDSMTYHLSRVMHWVQNKSVAFYPTHILRQLHQNPWGEFAILHFYILDGSDRFANFIQWFSMVGSIVGVTLLARELKATTRGQIFAAVVCATIPMGILQGSSTQTDYVVSFWLVCLAYFTITFIQKSNLLYAWGTGAALGLAILTKATAYIFALPFIAGLVLSSVLDRSISYARRMVHIAIVFIVAIVINLGHVARNYDLYGNPLGPGQESAIYAYANGAYSLSTVTSNIIRNVGLHLGTPFGTVNAISEKAIFALHRRIGISPNDERTTWTGTQFHIGPLSFHEDYTGNPLHLLFIVVSLALHVFQRPREKDAGRYVFSIMLAFLLFCAYLKWQPWHSRLHLPLFVLAAPFVGLRTSCIRHSRIRNLSLWFLMVIAVPSVFYNSSRPVLGTNSIFTMNRTEQCFSNRPALANSYLHTVETLSGLHCSDVGLVLGEDDWEYPFWILFREKTAGTVRLEHVIVTNVSQQKQDANHLRTFKPCTILAMRTDMPSVISIGDSLYSREWSFDSISVYKPTSSP